MSTNQDPTPVRGDPTPEPQGQPEPVPAPATPAQGEAGVDWKATSRQWEARSKANKKRAEEAEAKNAALAGELAQAQDQLAQASQHTRELELSLASHEVAAEYQVDASLLRGGTREELEEHAKALSEWKGTGQAAPLLGHAPVGAGSSSHVEQFLRELLNKN